MPEFQLSSKGMKSPPLDVFASLDTKTKTAVTRCYNALSHKSQALVETMQAPKKAKKRKAPPKSLAMEVRMKLTLLRSWSRHPWSCIVAFTSNKVLTLNRRIPRGGGGCVVLRRFI